MRIWAFTGHVKSSEAHILLTLVFCNINIGCTNAQNFFLSVTPNCIIFVNLSYVLLANIFDV